MVPSPPPSVTAAVPEQPWIPLSGPDPRGHDGWCDHTWPGRSWSVGSRIVRAADPGHRRVIGDEVTRLAWLHERGVAPELLAVDGDWLVIDAGPASPAHQPEAQPEPDAVPAKLGEAFRLLHELDITECPFTRTWAEVVGALTAAIANGALRVERLREPYCRYEPARLIELIEEGRPDGDGDVVVHGGPALSNVLLATTEPASFVGVHRLGVGDRHLDLAIITNQLQLAFGAEALYGFYEAYGRDPDLLRLDHFVLIDAIAAAVDPITVQRWPVRR